MIFFLKDNVENNVYLTEHRFVTFKIAQYLNYVICLVYSDENFQKVPILELFSSAKLVCALFFLNV